MTKKKIPDPHKPLTAAEWKSMGKSMHGAEELPASAREAVLRLRGRPKAAAPKAHVNIRIDEDIIAVFRKSGKGWQTRLNSLLRDAVERGAV